MRFVLGFLGRLSSGGSLIFQLGVSVLGGNTLPPSRVPVFGSSLGAVMLLGVSRLCSLPSMVVVDLG